jgi:hypothetical protein
MRLVANVPTDQRSAVKVLLRLGTPFGGAPANRRIGAYVVLILREARVDDWPGFYRVGDVEGVVWTTPRQTAQVIESLRVHPEVVAAKRAGA